MSIEYQFKEKKIKKVWHCFIPLFIEIPISFLIVILYGTHEINSFYADPNHIGFAIPAGAFFLAFIFFCITIVLLIICLIAAHIRRKRNNKIMQDLY